METVFVYRNFEPLQLFGLRNFGPAKIASERKGELVKLTNLQQKVKAIQVPHKMFILMIPATDTPLLNFIHEPSVSSVLKI